MALLAAVEAVGQGVFRLLAVQVRVVLRAALVAESPFGGGAIAEEVLPGSAFQTSFLMPLGVLELGHFLLFLGQFLLDPPVFFSLYAIAFFLRVHHAVRWIVECLLQLCQLCVDASAFGLVVLSLLLLFLGLQTGDLLSNFLQGQVDFLRHPINFIIMHSQRSL